MDRGRGADPLNLHPWWPAGAPLPPHPLFEALAYAVAFRVFTADRARQGDVVGDATTRVALLVAAVAGAAVGAKGLVWLSGWPQSLTDPTSLYTGGKTIVGGLLGGVLAVELLKPRLGIRVPTGDLYVRPLWIGLAIGRVGCFLSGTTDATHGLPSSLPWAMDLGDGVPRHPTALYEIGFLVALGIGLGRARLPRPGDRFAAFLLAYLGFRFLVDELKPDRELFLGVSAIQLACLVGGSAFGGWVARRRRAEAYTGAGDATLS